VPETPIAYGRADRVVLAEIRDTPLSVEEVLASVDHPAAGGHVLFVGTVRDHDGGRGVVSLGYLAHPSAGDRLAEVVATVADCPGVVAVSAVHRTGSLVVGDVAVVVAVSSAHRGEAFLACERLIDSIKDTVPIWKEQVFLDGSHEWVGGL